MTVPYLIGAGITFVGMSAALLGEAYGSKAAAGIAKMVASTGFLLAGWGAGGLESAYGRLVLVGLALGWVGDLLLIFRSRRFFYGGLASFLAGHLSYVAAFSVRGLDGPSTVGALLGFLVPPALVVARWLRPHLDGTMRLAVHAYIVAISLMAATAVGTCAHVVSLPLIVGAFSFYVSDISVARDTFVAPGLVNKLWGGPTYFGGQLLLAASVA